MDLDSLDATLKKLNEQIRNKEAEITRIHAELQALLNKANKLDEARSIIAEETSAAQAYAMKQVVESRHSFSLQDEVLECLRFPSASDGGSTAGEITAMLKARDYPNADSKNFYPGVYTTLKRLTKKGEIDSFVGPRGRLFRLKDATANLFNSKENKGLAQ